MYTYRAKVMKVVDGDTLDVVIDLGFFRRVGQEDIPDSWARVRLLGQLDDDPELEGIDAFEPRLGRGTTPAMKAKGLEAKALATSLCLGEWVTVRTMKDDKESFGRWLAAVQLADGRDLGRVLYDAGLATEWSD